MPLQTELAHEGPLLSLDMLARHVALASCFSIFRTNAAMSLLRPFGQARERGFIPGARGSRLPELLIGRLPVSFAELRASDRDEMCQDRHGLLMAQGVEDSLYIVRQGGALLKATDA